MQIIALPRYVIERSAPPAFPHAVISITTTKGDQAEIPDCPERVGLLRVSFPDRDQVPSTGPNDLFNEFQAGVIWSFVTSVLDKVELLVVHCDMGQCRSPAVAAAISKVVLGDDMEFFKRHTPNMHVYRTMLEVWYSNPNEVG